jgi:hypothetical protein
MSSSGLPQLENDAEALISVELDMINPGCPTNTTDETVYIGNLQFNNLDFIGIGNSWLCCRNMIVCVFVPFSESTNSDRACFLLPSSFAKVCQIVSIPC